MKEGYRKSLVLAIFALFVSVVAWGQGVRIPGDTTGRSKKDSVTYGPSTTKFIYQRDLKYNQLEYRSIDTVVTGVHNYTSVETFGNGMQYLGTIGSAATSIFPVVPDVIGVSSGFDAYDIYYQTPDDVKYYNTQSPYTKLVITFGGNDRSVNDITFSRNITKNWNAGFNVRTLAINKQLGPTTSQGQGDKYSRSYLFNFFTSYKSQNEKYNLMATFSRFSHFTRESGGLINITGSDQFSRLEEFYQYNDANNIWFSNGSTNPSPMTREYRFDYHLYHQYELNDYLQVYHEFDLYHQHNYLFYEPSNGEIDTAYYFKRALLDSTHTGDFNRYKLLQNEIGFKGNLEALFYNVYFKLRNASMEYVNDTSYNILPSLRATNNFRRNNEVYGGFNLRLDLGKKTYFSGGAEYLNTNSYRISANFVNPILNASYTRARVLPSYLDQQYVGNHNYWNNNFGSVGYDQLKGSIEYDFGGWLYLKPFLTATNINNPIYYQRDTVANVQSVIAGNTNPDRQAFPVQANGGVQVLSPGFKFSIDFLKAVHFENTVTYSLVSGNASQAMPIPEIYGFSRLYFMNDYLDGKLTMQLGVDIKYGSQYLGYDYDLATQQFFIQQQRYGSEFNLDFLIDNFDLMHPEYPYYAVADLFFVMKVRKTRIYLRVPQVNKGFPTNGYFTTPYYAGQDRVFDIGVNWLFFD